MDARTTPFSMPADTRDPWLIALQKLQTSREKHPPTDQSGALGRFLLSERGALFCAILAEINVSVELARHTCGFFTTRVYIDCSGVHEYTSRKNKDCRGHHETTTATIPIEKAVRFSLRHNPNYTNENDIVIALVNFIDREVNRILHTQEFCIFTTIK